MGILILSGIVDNIVIGACFVDSVTERVFGRVLDDKEEAESFLEWEKRDLRSLSYPEFEKSLSKFRKERLEEHIQKKY